jgi:DNA-binding transcriptional regulator YiaG
MRRSDLLLLVEAQEMAANGRAREIREEARLTQGLVGETVGVTAACVSFWEAGKRRPRGAPALRWARLLRKLSEREAAES